MNTLELLDAVKARYDLPSDYAAAKLLPVGKSAISKWRAKGLTMDDTTGLVVAKLLDLDPAQVFAWLHAERSKSHQEKRVWDAMARRLGQALVLCLVVGLAGVDSQPAAAGVTLPGYTLHAVAALVLAALLGATLRHIRRRPARR